MTTTPSVVVRGLTRSFGTGTDRLEVLDGVDLVVGRGEFVSILGPSGCGKSTLLDIVAGLDEQDTGVVEVDGTPERIGVSAYMPQSDLLMPWKRIVDNVALGPVVAGIPRPQARAAAREMLHRLGLDGFADHWPPQLSEGMRQRAALARTFLSGRDVLLLDEPFGALDSLTRQRAQTWLLDVWRTASVSVLFVTHDVDEALRLADRVCVLAPRPTSVVATIPIALPRPRPPDVVLTPEFIDLKRHTLTHLGTGGGPP